MKRNVTDTIEVISQHIRLLTACLEIEEGEVYVALANQKSALEWTLKLLGAEPADAPVAPQFDEPPYSLSEFRDYCAHHDVAASDVEVVFLQWLYSPDNTLYGAVATDPHDTSSFVVDSIIEQSHEVEYMPPRQNNGMFWSGQ